MNKYKKRLIITLTLILVLTALPITSLGVELENTLELDQSLLFYIETLDYVKTKYPFEILDRELINNSIKGMLQGLDENSNYYTKEEADIILKGLLGNYAGIGVVIENQEGNIIVNSVMKNSPAEKSGLKKGDTIVSVDNIKINDLSLEDVSNLIRGLPDTKVKLGIIRNNSPKPIYLDITRGNIKVNPVDYKILEKDIGYIKITDFNPYATTYTKEALQEFNKKNIDKIILDLRDNPGGLLPQAINIAELFVPEGPIVHIRTNKGITTHISTNQNPKYKLVVLINENSASASEILAGAIKERQGGTLVGKKTYGKGTVQTMLPLPDGSILKLTTAEYLLPNKTSIHKKGIEPHIEVENVEGKDLQLQKAIEILRE